MASFSLTGARSPTQRHAVSCVINVVPPSSQQELRTSRTCAAPFCCAVGWGVSFKAVAVQTNCYN